MTDQTTAVNSNTRSATIAATVVGVVSVGWAILFSVLGLLQFRRLYMHAYDLGIFSQGTWLLSRFKEPFVTIRGLNLFADHSSYILFGVVPFYRVFPSGGTLVVITAAVLAITAPLAYTVARRAGAGPLLAATVGVLVLLQPALQWQVRDAFHPEMFVIPLVVGAVALLQRDRDVWALVFIGVALTAKEDVGLLVVPFGIAVAWFMGKRRTGLIVVALGVGAFLLNFLVLLPAWSPTGELLYSYRYEHLGSTPIEIMFGLLTSPMEWWNALTDSERLVYMAGVSFAMPFAFVAPRWLLVGVPALMANLFTNHAYQYEIEYHYTAYLVATVVVAGAFGVAKVQDWKQRRWRVAAVVISIVVAIGTWVTAGPTDGWAGSHAHHNQVAAIIEVIPDDESVSAWTTLVPPLANRDEIYLFPSPWELSYYGAEGVEGPDPDSIEWVFVRFDSYRKFDHIIESLLSSGDYEIAVDDAPFMLLHRK